MGCRSNWVLITETGLRKAYFHWGADRILSSIAEGPVSLRTEFEQAGAEDMEEFATSEMPQSIRLLDDIWSEGSFIIDEPRKLILFELGGRPYNEHDGDSLHDAMIDAIELTWDGFAVLQVDHFHELVRYLYYQGYVPFETLLSSWNIDEDRITGEAARKLMAFVGDSKEEREKKEEKELVAKKATEMAARVRHEMDLMSRDYSKPAEEPDADDKAIAEHWFREGELRKRITKTREEIITAGAELVMLGRKLEKMLAAHPLTISKDEKP